jgi:hypothetical protein
MKPHSTAGSIRHENQENNKVLGQRIKKEKEIKRRSAVGKRVREHPPP